MRILILLTTSFPYGSKEPFIESELPIMCHSFDKVITYALYANENVRKIDIPNNYYSHNVSSSKRERVLSILKVSFNLDFWKEFFFILRNKTYIVPRIKHLIKFSCYAIAPYARIVNSLKTYNIDSKNNKLYFYSYWFVEHAFIAQKLKRRFRGFLSFSRAHGYDLYEGREKYGYIPYRRFLCNKLDYVFPISDNGKILLDSYGGRAKVVLSRLGTLDGGFSPFKKNKDQITIVSCSWCVPVKRLHLIIEALSLVDKTSIHWIHIGDGPILKELNELAIQKLRDNITYDFRGRLTNMEIRSFYKNTSVDLFINVSLSEGVPVSIMEAFSFGIPTIATNVGGVSEIVIDSFNGWLLDLDFKPVIIANLLENYVNMSEEDITALRKNSRSLWQKSFNANTNYKVFYSMLSRYNG